MENFEKNTNEKTEIIYCDCCGCEISESENGYTTNNGDYICEDCFNENYIVCVCCGEIIPIDEAIQTQDTERFYCKDCARDELYQCEDCGNWYAQDYRIITTAYGTSICEDCADYNYTTCENCGELYHNDDIHYNEDDRCYYCEDCYDELEDENIIKNYHYHKHEFEKRKTSKEAKKPLFFGFELEVESGSNCNISNNEMAQAIDCMMNNDVVFENDGSLNDGFEIISQPMTYKYLKQNKGKFEKMLQILIENGYVSHNSSHCGLHIHLTRDYFTYNEIDKFQLLIEKFKKELTIFSRRHLEQQKHWAKFISDEHDTDENLDIDYIKKYKNKYDRYYALNLSNSETIEFRLLRGTLKYNTFMASFELLNNISKIVKNTSIKNIEKLKFEDIIKYGKNNKHLVTYCIEKNLVKGVL